MNDNGMSKGAKHFLARCCASDLRELAIVWFELAPQLTGPQHLDACRYHRVCNERDAEINAWLNMPKRLRKSDE